MGLQTITTTPVTLTAERYRKIVLVDATGGSRVVILPTAVSNADRIFVIKMIATTGSNTTLLQTSASQFIDGASSQELKKAQESIEVVSNGANWFIIG